ncbi:hypothetical protein EXIGLDRAFT_717317 [Exidia glandulosa HHB12029]|uniref:Alpha-ketoglutarate-dependent dioxygenase AlkB-like domain-containing protein n=1 Tax=Exidia glandulosa HHB12029 TaxID=1314781 RepID=A0A165IFJ3_EXIGL|nr:hypothetical protein EXIGLDRAFT_717317 [Exidia glandulosa HHB12029]
MVALRLARGGTRALGGLLKGVRAAHSNVHQQLPADFTLVPEFLSVAEQCTLLHACLEKLDAMESRETRKRRRAFLQSQPLDTRQGQAGSPADLFLPDKLYEFQEGHYDGVIRNYREMHASTWPASPALDDVLGRVHALLPESVSTRKADIQSHILHLASNGYIEAHIDNVGASGSWILGVSLGEQRDMLLQSVEPPHRRHQISLPSGSVYLQKDSVRYNFKHSILPGEGQRVSFMIRDFPKREGPR